MFLTINIGIAISKAFKDFDICSFTQGEKRGGGRILIKKGKILVIFMFGIYYFENFLINVSSAKNEM